MTSIDEAISHAKEVAAIQRNNEKLNRTLGSALKITKQLNILERSKM